MSHIKQVLAVVLGFALTTGCEAHMPTTPLPALDANSDRLADLFFRAPLVAPVGTVTTDRTLLALPSSPHLLGPEFSASTPGPAANADVAFNTSNNTCLAVFELNGDIYGRILTSQGMVIISDFPIAATSHTEAKPRVVYVSALDQFVVVYTRLNTGLDVLAQRVGSSGAQIGVPLTVSGASGNQDAPDLAYDSVNGKVLCVWQDGRSGDDDVYARLLHFSQDGLVAETAETLVGNSAPDLSDNLAPQTAPRVAFSPQTSKYVVVFEDGRNKLTSGQDIYGQVISIGGQKIWENFPVSTRTGRQGAPAIAYNPLTRYFAAVFEDESNGASDGDIVGRALTADGQPIFSEGTVDDEFGVQANPDISFNPLSWTWLVAWENHGTATNLNVPSMIQGRHFGPSFEIGDVFGVTANTVGRHPSVAVNSLAGQFLVIYDQLGGSRTDGLDGQRVDRGY